MFPAFRALPAAAAAFIAAAQDRSGLETPPEYPGPSPWEAITWGGAALYLLLFAAGLRGVWLLVRSGPDAGPEPPADPSSPAAAGGEPAP